MTITTNSSDNIPILHRPLFDGCSTPEEHFTVAMKEYDELKDTDENGLDFTQKTSQWIAYERQIESEREDRLFNDMLAKYFVGAYGKRLSNSMSYGMAFSVFDPPGCNIGFGLEGHVMYTAARTKLINDWLEKWAKIVDNYQVLNLGAGLDTRQYWLGCLKKARSYWEIDTSSVMAHKQQVLDQLKANNELPDTLCPTMSISMDFTKESIEDLPSKYGYDMTIPSCWILEGLIMYLGRSDVEQLMDNISNLSSRNSYIILNFATNNPTGPTIGEIGEQLAKSGWKKEAHLMFGEDGFNYNRYPDGKPPNKILGFTMYRKRE